MHFFFSVENIAFSVFGYSLSWVELIGTVFSLWSVWLVAKRRILTWPVGIIGIVFFMALFYQIRLYSDAVEQVYYLGASIYGWWLWNKSPRNNGKVVAVQFSNKMQLLLWAGVTAVVAIIAGWLMSRVHLVWPSVFPVAASYAYLDALTTIMSFTAQWLMAQKKTESWIYWIIVDILGIWLYYVKDVKFVALLYVILLCMAVNGLRLWSKKDTHAQAASE